MRKKQSFDNSESNISRERFIFIILWFDVKAKQHFEFPIKKIIHLSKSSWVTRWDTCFFILIIKHLQVFLFHFL